jgi:hypothetical protein
VILMTIEVFQAKRETDSLGEAAVSQLPSHNFDPRTSGRRERRPRCFRHGFEPVAERDRVE